MSQNSSTDDMTKDRKPKLDWFSIIDNISSYSNEEIAELIEEGVITTDDVYLGSMMDRIWNTDYTEWPRA